MCQECALEGCQEQSLLYSVPHADLDGLGWQAQTSVCVVIKSDPVRIMLLAYQALLISWAHGGRKEKSNETSKEDRFLC